MQQVASKAFHPEVIEVETTMCQFHLSCFSRAYLDVPCGSKRIALQRVWQLLRLGSGHGGLLYVRIASNRSGGITRPLCYFQDDPNQQWED
jgi:hypothetical protein